jgi:hypothetical protein
MTRQTASIVALGAALGIAAGASGDIITQWNFNSQTLNPSLGSGTLSTVGGVSGGTFAQAGGSSDPTQPGFGWQTNGYAPQGQGSGSAGIEIRVSTMGWEDITLRWDQRHSNTSSRWAEVQYSWDGGINFFGLELHEATAGETWFNSRSTSLAGLPGAAHNAELVIRIVSVFAPGTLAYQATNAGSNYSGAGSWRFDMISVEGTMAPVPAPGALALLALAGAAGGNRRRRMA